jgi:hypothetical protein
MLLLIFIWLLVLCCGLFVFLLNKCASMSPAGHQEMADLKESAIGGEYQAFPDVTVTGTKDNGILTLETSISGSVNH